MNRIWLAVLAIEALLVVFLAATLQGRPPMYFAASAFVLAGQIAFVAWLEKLSGGFE